MNKLINTFRVLLVLIVGVVCAAGAYAADKVHLKNGKVIEGTIVREVEGAIWIETIVGGLKTEQMYGPSDIAKVERDVASTPAPAAPTSETRAAAAAPAPSGPKVPKAAILSLGDEANGNMVGVYMTAEIIKRAIPELEKELGTDKTGVLILRIHSGGGFGSEVGKINDLIQKELKPRWRTVAWIETAISAAAMASHGIEEIYFMSQGNYGGCVGFYGSLDRPVEGYPLEVALADMERISKDGNYHPDIMRAMQLQMPLSAKVKDTGDVEYYRDLTSGDIIVNRENEVLTFNAQSAAKVKFSKGTADTLDELARLMGYQELEWIGQRTKDAPYPVSRAEKMQIDFRRQVKFDESAVNSYYATYQREIAAAATEQDPRERGRFVGRARQMLEKIKGTVKNNPAFKVTIFGNPEQYDRFVREEEKRIRDLMRR
jgi:hypothetical protein